MVMVQALLTMVAAVAATIVFASPAEAPQIEVMETAGVYRVSATFSVAAPMTTVSGVLTDYERIPKFMPGVQTSQVLGRTATGLVVEQEATAKFMMFSKKVHLVLDVSHDGGTIRFHDRCGKSFKTYEGAWRLASSGVGTTVVYELTAQPRFEVPSFVLKRLLKRDAAVMIERLKAEIEARASLPD
jgi:carbon monoxide dehydrogenase subunit G